MLKDEMLLYRARNNLSQRQLAEMCKVTLQTINQVERERKTPSKLTEAKIRLVIGGQK